MISIFVPLEGSMPSQARAAVIGNRMVMRISFFMVQGAMFRKTRCRQTTDSAVMIAAKPQGFQPGKRGIRDVCRTCRMKRRVFLCGRSVPPAGGTGRAQEKPAAPGAARRSRFVCDDRPVAVWPCGEMFNRRRRYPSPDRFR